MDPIKFTRDISVEERRRGRTAAVKYGVKSSEVIGPGFNGPGPTSLLRNEGEEQL